VNPLFNLYFTGWVLTAGTFILMIMVTSYPRFEDKLVRYGSWIPLTYLFFTACASVFYESFFFAFPCFLMTFLIGVTAYCFAVAVKERHMLYGVLIFSACLHLCFMVLVCKYLGAYSN